MSDERHKYGTRADAGMNPVENQRVYSAMITI